VSRFECPNCGQKIRTPDDQAGGVGRCPRCKSKITVPGATGAQDRPALRDLLDLPSPAQAAPSENQAEEVATLGADRDRSTSLAADPLAEVIEESRFPWFLDALAYPVSSSGAVNIAVFVIVPRLVAFAVSLLTRFIQSALPMGGAGYLTTLLTAPLYVVFACYVCYYIAHCVTDSSRGHRRASDIQITGALSIGDLLSQTILLVASVAITCWPVAVYYVLTERTDEWYWLLGTCGVFFLPMSFLAGVIFDSFDALNPLLIVQSIWRTFIPYCGLALFFLAITGLGTAVIPRLAIWAFLRLATQIYLLLVLANGVGRFYWRYRDKLDWGI
jgi:DNA-directed RNA polymerase subunit RPC12/RpoP